MTVRLRHRQGFTLIEMLIVGSLIALFAGLAMFGAQQMYDSNRKKAMLDECKSIASALSFARQEVGFYPRIHVLGLPLSKLRFKLSTDDYYCQPALDALGYYGTGKLAAKLSPVFAMKNWSGPYMTVSEARALNASGRRSGLVRMRLPDKDYASFPNNALPNEDPTLVDWPTDTWGNPYVFYMVCYDSTLVTPGQNPKGLRLSKNPAEEGDSFMAVVSYGPNHVPGGNDKSPGFGADTMLYVQGDLSGKNQADYTLKSVDSQYPAALLDNSNLAWVAQFAQSIESTVTPSQIGITDNGSDDIFFKF